MFLETGNLMYIMVSILGKLEDAAQDEAWEGNWVTQTLAFGIQTENHCLKRAVGSAPRRTEEQ